MVTAGLEPPIEQGSGVPGYHRTRKPLGGRKVEDPDVTAQGLAEYAELKAGLLREPAPPRPPRGRPAVEARATPAPQGGDYADNQAGRKVSHKVGKTAFHDDRSLSQRIMQAARDKKGDGASYNDQAS